MYVWYFINSKFEGFQHDKPIWTESCDCTIRRRIDHRKLIGNTLLVIETDDKDKENSKNKLNKEDQENSNSNSNNSNTNISGKLN